MDPPPHPLLASELRVERAWAHMLELRAELERYIDDHRGVWSIVRNKEGELTTRQVGPVPPMPPLPSILIGEVVYNLRAALDYIVYTLAFYAVATEVDGTQWPIEDDPNVFVGRYTGKNPETGKRVAKWLEGVPTRYIEHIERVQPYNPGAEWSRTLRELSNPDKHRTLTPLHGKGSAEYTGPTEVVWEPGQEEAEIDARWHVRMEFNVAKMDVPLLPTAKLLHDQVASVVDLFKSFFNPRPGVG